MNQKGNSIIILLITSLVSGIVVLCYFKTIVLAVPAAPSPLCEVKAQILDMTYQQQEIRTASYSRSSSKNYPSPSPNEIRYFSTKLKILSTKLLKNNGTSRSCSEIYKETSEIPGVILSESEFDKLPVAPEQQIQAKLHFSGDEFFGGIIMTDVKVTGGKATVYPEKVIEISPSPSPQISAQINKVSPTPYITKTSTPQKSTNFLNTLWNNLFSLFAH